jgi:hypothetical protein
MDNGELLEFYQYRMFKKLIDMQYAERAAYLMDILGRRWMEVYAHLTNIYPQLINAPNMHSRHA